MASVKTILCGRSVWYAAWSHSTHHGCSPWGSFSFPDKIILTECIMILKSIAGKYFFYIDQVILHAFYHLCLYFLHSQTSLPFSACKVVSTPQQVPLVSQDASLILSIKFPFRARPYEAHFTFKILFQSCGAAHRFHRRITWTLIPNANRLSNVPFCSASIYIDRNLYIKTASLYNPVFAANKLSYSLWGKPDFNCSKQ